MGRRARSELPKDLAQGRSQFQAWRAQRTAGRIPQTLWALAVRLASRHGVRRTATALGLDYDSLMKRSQEANGPAPASGPAFIELPAQALVGKQATLELDRGAGATLRVHLVGYDAAEVAALARSSWNAE